jgi:abortive infection bacteriophage resistance protein
LIIDNEEEAKKSLLKMNYYRLSGYWYSKQEIGSNLFIKGTTFSSILNEYYFDKELRKLIFAAIDTIEVSFRTTIAYYFSENISSFPISKQNYVQSNLTNHIKIDNQNKQYSSLIKTVLRETNRSQLPFITHFKEKYSQEIPPIWMLVEIISFGTLSKLYTLNTKRKAKKEVAKFYGLSKHDIISTWLWELSIVRNKCAHHSRVWNLDYYLKHSKLN